MVSGKEIIENVENLLAPIIREEDLELVSLEFKASGKRWLLRVTIDKEGGVTISDCETVNRALGRILEVEDVIEHPYTLEVSSPGLTRPLKTREDFLRAKGKSCKIVTLEAVEGKKEFSGQIVGIEADNVELRGKLGVFTIPFCAIKKAHLEFEL
jgi:ribosome maturation factor RimP